MIKYLLFLTLFFSIERFAQLIKTPLEINNYEKITLYQDLTEFIYYLEGLSDVLTVEVIGKSVDGRNIYALKYSNSEFGKDESKIKVLIFAQQHGNEQSGKEGALLLASRLIRSDLKDVLNKVDLILIPQMNPDGSETNQRRNGNGADLNRNHLILTEPETIALHKLFNEYKFEVTMDVHEYFPYSESWNEFGYIKSADEQFGLTTNLNVSDQIRNYSKERVLPFIGSYLNERGFSFNEYVVGGPPNLDRLRHSTVDIDDGRQSFGIQNTLSFILEGKNGKEYAVENIKHRSEGQAAAMLGLLGFVHDNADEIKSLIKTERERLINFSKTVVLRMEHTENSETISLPVTIASNDKDTIIDVSNYHPTVENLFEVSLPDAYIVPGSDSLLLKLIERHSIYFEETLPEILNIEQYIITGIDTIELENIKLADVQVRVNQKTINDLDGKYVLIPTNQSKKNTITLAFEPQSMLGLIHYNMYKYLIENNEYPILRVFRD
ncbi:MAG: M14 family zinc carboxypeptidase [Ignavibacteriaceae bacterium]